MLEINRDKAIKILEQYDANWDYEDMTDEELVQMLVRVTGCSAEQQRQIQDCMELTCTQCWARRLSA